MEKNKAQCMNGHWFDADKFSVCPHCGEKKKGGEVTATHELVASLETENPDKVKKKGLFWNRKEKNKEAEIRMTGGVSEAAANPNVERISYENSIIHSISINSKEVSLNSEMLESQRLPHTEVLIKPIGKSLNVQGMNSAEVQKKESVTAVKKDIDDIKTISIYANIQGEEPVTGWLVGVRGEYKGNSFNLKTGVNVISRDASAYVCLKKDAQVSRGKHATIIYEPKKKVFYIGEGENTMTYCNDELVCGKQELKSYDSIEIGGGSYLFIPFCGEQFDWDKE